MTTPAVPPPNPPEPQFHRHLGQRIWDWLSQTRPEFQVGTLQYTGRRMLMVFAWLLIGDFCLMMLDTNIPEILPLKLKSLGAGDTTNAFLNKTIAYTVVFLLAPIVSVRSDRTRTRWGRRIPYLLWSAPFVGLFLVLIGHYESIANLFAGNATELKILGVAISRSTLTLIVLAVLIIGWDFANIFVNTVYYYLFNDVVPAKYLSRFLALFRIVSSLAGMAYGKWVFPHSMTHFKPIFVIAGIAYAIGFLIMCIMVREGEYPPPPANIDRRPGFFREDTPPVPGRRVDATVKWFNASKGFGFVTMSDGTQDAFLPMAILRRAGFDDVREGSLITCEVSAGAGA